MTMDMDGEETVDGSATARQATRSTHLVDRALEYRQLARRGWTPAAIGKRKRKSKGYVSILLRFGEILEAAGEIDLALFRHHAVTYKLLQQIVRGDADARTIHRKLRAAIAMPKPDGRRRRRLRLPAAPPAADPDAFTFRWDPAWAARDPLGYLDATAAYLRRVQRGIDHRLRKLLSEQAISDPATAASTQHTATGTTVATVARAGGSLRALVSASGRQKSRSPTTPRDEATADAVRRRLAELEAVLLFLDTASRPHTG